jgi:hypothetical protein
MKPHRRMALVADLTVRSMHRFPKLTAFASGLLACLAVFVIGGEAAIAVGKATNSGPLGICGPYGPHADLVGFMFLGSLPVGVVGGIFAGRRIYWHLARNEKKT